MLRLQSHTKAFAMAAMIFLLCLVCLSGATLALFTNDKNDGTIGVVTTTGSLSVDIVDTAGESLQTKALDFVTTSGTSKSEHLFFEPGATFYTQGFCVKNNGDIPAKYTISVSKKEGISLDAFKEVFDIWIVEEGQDPFSGVPMDEFCGTVAKDDVSTTYYLYIKMKETIGNDFQGKVYTGIGITVYAVQGNATIGGMTE